MATSDSIRVLLAEVAAEAEAVRRLLGAANADVRRARRLMRRPGRMPVLPASCRGVHRPPASRIEV